MNSDISYDPVSVIDEKEAIGETAKIFKDIRDTMNIPLITSIWRGLAEIDDSLKKIWTIARPIYETQNPEKKLKVLYCQNLQMMNFQNVDLPLKIGKKF